MSKRFSNEDFEKQVLSHLDLLYFTALKVTGHPQDAEDLIQETYYKAFNQFNQLRDLQKCKPWLYRIMINTWKNWRVKRSKEILTGDQEHLEYSMLKHTGGNLQTHQINPEEGLMIKELWKNVNTALTRLPQNYRMVIILSDIEGFSYKEISKIMEWPMGTVMSSLSRARHQLGSLLAKHHNKRT